MISFPNAKINIGLYVTGKRPDGYHDLESVFYPIPYLDVLELIPAENFSFHTDGLSVTHRAEDNLCVKAYNLLQEEFDLPPVEIFLLKNIPAGAGMGGGSSDASSTLKLMNEAFQLGLSQESLEVFAAKIGSDCPFFIGNTPALVKGRGEDIRAIDLELSGNYLTIIYPGIHISTAKAFQKISIGPANIDLNTISNLPISEWQARIRNVFEPYAMEQFPVINEIKTRLLNLGALYVSMTGSGSAIFALSTNWLNTAGIPGKVWQTRL